MNYDYENQKYENNSIIGAISHVMKLLVNVVRYLLGIFALIQVKIEKIIDSLTKLPLTPFVPECHIKTFGTIEVTFKRATCQYF